MSASIYVITNISFFALSPYFYWETETIPVESSLTDYIDCNWKPYTLFHRIDTAQNYRGMWISGELSIIAIEKMVPIITHSPSI